MQNFDSSVQSLRTFQLLQWLCAILFQQQFGLVGMGVDDSVRAHFNLVSFSRESFDRFNTMEN